MRNKILLVDDDEGYNFLNSRLVRRTEVFDDILTFLNGRAALEYLQQLDAENLETPIPVLLDIKMPVMHGLEFLEQIQNLQSEVTNRLRIAMLSSSIDPKDRVRAMQFKQVVTFLEKPLDEEKLCEFIRKAMA